MNTVIELQSVWGWQPALYLFLGGVGAGTFFVAGLVHLATRSHKRIVSVSMWSAIVLLAVGLGCLLMEVSAPLRALMMWQSFSNLGNSWMAVGAWLLFLAMACFFVAAVLNTEGLVRRLSVSEGARTIADGVFTVAGMLLGLCVAVYTGILLMEAPGVPFWNTELLPMLFTVSALDTGVAFVAILFAILEPQEHKAVRFLELSTLVLVVLETVVLIAFVKAMLAGGNPLFETMEPGYAATAAASANAWLSGQLAGAFWALFIVVGLASPFVLALLQLMLRLGNTSRRVLAVTASICVLVGGCTLRFITLMAGAHVDVLANTVTMLF